MNSIFKYLDYRAFLNDYYKEMKENTSFFSYRWFAQKTGTNSPSFLKDVILGKRNLTPSATEKFIKALSISKKEADFFRVLVSFNQADLSSEKQKFYAIILSMTDYISDYQLGIDQYEFYSKWYYSVIRELLPLIEDEEINYDKLAKRVIPTITIKEAKDSVALLIRLGLIHKTKNGKYIQSEAVITSGNSDKDILSQARRLFHQQMILLAEKSINRFPVNKRYASGITVGISSSCYEMLIQEFSAFRERIISIVDRDDKSDQVYQINFQFFPLSESQKANSKESVKND